MPRRCGVVVVANHFNGLVDGALLLAHLPRRPSFLAKSTLWDVPLLQPLLDLAGAIPVIRRQDLAPAGSSSPAGGAERNRETFARCEELLAGGGVVALFPEGTTHPGPGLRPLRTGAARIALRTATRAGAPSLSILPVGLHFDAPHRFRSRALIEIGEPLVVEDVSGDDPPAVTRLTARIGTALEALTPSYASWEEARLLERAAELYRRHLESGSAVTSGLPTEPTDQRRPYFDAYERLRRRHPDEVAAVVGSLVSYRRLLATFGVREDLIELGGVAVRAAIVWSIRRTAALLVLLPLAAVGVVLNWPPYRLVGWVATRWAEGPEVVSTYKLSAALVAFPAMWGLESVALGLLAGLASGVAMLVLAPLSGLVALSFGERRRELEERARTWVLLRRGRLAAELARRREQILRQMEHLRELDRESMALDDSSRS